MKVELEQRDGFRAWKSLKNYPCIIKLFTFLGTGMLHREKLLWIGLEKLPKLWSLGVPFSGLHILFLRINLILLRFGFIS